MINLPRLTLIALVALLITALSACGGGGTSSEGGIGGSGISMGVMQDQSTSGSQKTVTVNGVTFDATNTQFFEEGANTTAASVQNGMVVVVQGTIDANGLTGTANSISYADILEGPISNISGNTITAMGQSIIVDANTRYSGTGVIDLSSLMVGNVIEVSGFFTANNDIYATYIERTDDTNHEIKGVITAIADATNFDIGNLMVSGASTSGLMVDDFVKAEGSMNGATTLEATSVSVLNRNLAIADADDAEVEGLATTACSAAAPPCTFMLGFITVQVNSGTQFEGGLLANVQPGIRLEVEGSLSNNVVIAEEIEFKDSVELQSDVSEKNADTLTLEFGLDDVTVKYDPLVTKLEGFASFAAITAGVHVEVRARHSGSELIATRIENKAGDHELVLQGPVGFALLPQIQILNVTLDTTSMNHYDRNEQLVLQDVFFATVSAEDLVKAKGEINTGVITWQEMKIEQ